MICTNCGQELNENMKYCNKCGIKIIQNYNLNNGTQLLFISVILLSLSTFSSIYSYKNDFYYDVYFSQRSSPLAALFLLSTFCYPIFGIISFIKFKYKLKIITFWIYIILLGLPFLYLLLFFLSIIFHFRIF